MGVVGSVSFMYHNFRKKLPSSAGLQEVLGGAAPYTRFYPPVTDVKNINVLVYGAAPTQYFL